MVAVDGAVGRRVVEGREIEGEGPLAAVEHQAPRGVDRIGRPVGDGILAEQTRVAEDHIGGVRLPEVDEIVGIELVDAVLAADVDVARERFEAGIGVEDVGQQTVFRRVTTDRAGGVVAVVAQQAVVGGQPKLVTALDDLEDRAARIDRPVDFVDQHTGLRIVAVESAAVGADPEVAAADGQAVDVIGQGKFPPP